MKTNVVYNEECLKGMAERIDDNSIDMILADLPYGTTACSWDSIIPLEPLWKQYKRVIKDNGAIVLTASQPFTTKLISSNMEWFKTELIWEKEQGTNQFLADYYPLKKHENVLVFCKTTPKYNPQFEKTKRKITIRDKNGGFDNITGQELKPTRYDNKGKKYPTSIIKAERELNNRYHPTQKPVKLFEYLIKTFTDKQDIVLDNVMGSGTTAVACMKSDRKFIGFEQEEKYYNIALKRIGKFDKKYYDNLPESEKPRQEQLF